MLIYNYHHFTGYQLRMTSSHLLIVLVGIHYIRNYVIRDRNQNHPPPLFNLLIGSLVTKKEFDRLTLV